VITPAVLDAWPDVSRRVASRLRAAGVGAADAEDLTSEAITRAVAKGVTFESTDHLFAWTLHVARNIHVDQRRAVGRGPVVHGIVDSDVAPAPDTAVVVEHRLRLERALEVLATFSPADRAAVMDDGAPAVRRDAVRLAVRRHRARARLRAAIAGIAAILGRAVRPRRVAVAATPVALVGALVLTLAPHMTPFGGGAPDRRLPVVRMPVTAAAPVAAVRPATRQAATRPASTAGTVARHALERPAPPRHENIADVPVAPHTGATLYQRERQPDDPLICVRSVIVVCPREI
jgi:hypothetical protein